jgi:hypothetical protein
MESPITFLSQHVVTNFHAMKKLSLKKKHFDNYFWTQFKHDVHACIFTMMYMFVNCMYPCISRINPRPHANTLRS